MIDIAYLEEHYDLEHPMAKNHRLPIQYAWRQWAASVPLTLVLPAQNPEEGLYLGHWGMLVPTDEEMLILAEKNQEILSKWNSEHRIKQMRELPLDIDPGINMKCVAKTEEMGWVYCLFSFRGQSTAPQYGDKYRFNTLEELFEKL